MVARVALGDVEGARASPTSSRTLDPGNQVAAIVLLGDSLAKADYDSALAILGAQGEAMNPLLAGLARRLDRGRPPGLPAAEAKFDAMTGNDALAIYGQYHKALALAFAGDFVSAETILAGGPDGPLHLNRSAMVAHAEILAQMGRSSDAIALIDDALAGGVPDAPLRDLRDRLAAGEEVSFGQVTKASDGAAEAFLTLADALNNEESGGSP